MDTLTTKQFGDACEHLVLAELMLAGWAGHLMPSGWLGHDLTVYSKAGEPIMISVKGRRAGAGRTATAWRFDPVAAWDWLALVLANVDDRSRRVYLVPRAWMLGSESGAYRPGPGSITLRIRMRERGLERWRNNFALDPDPPDA
jgi:hypothetical protein